MLRAVDVAKLLLVVVAVAVVMAPSRATAQTGKPMSLHVLELDSDDADDQADALTNALRSRARSAPGWVLVDTTQSLSMLTAALRCPQHPDPACLQRIGDQLKTDRFIWGFVVKAPGHQVTAEVHFWARGKSDQSAKETYSDNLREAGDDTLRKIANRFFDRLTGGPAGTLVLRVGAPEAPAGLPGGVEATATVDGDQKVPIHGGMGSILVSPGTHVIDVSAQGFAPAQKTVVATAGASTDVSVELAPVHLAPPPSAPPSSRKTAAWVTVVTGGVLLAAGGVLAIAFESERSRLNGDREAGMAGNYSYGNSVAAVMDPCLPAPVPGMPTLGQTPQAKDGCSAHAAAVPLLVAEIATLSVGAILAGTGAYLLATEPKEKSVPAQQARGGLRNVKVQPTIAPNGASVALSASF